MAEIALLIGVQNQVLAPALVRARSADPNQRQAGAAEKRIAARVLSRFDLSCRD